LTPPPIINNVLIKVTLAMSKTLQGQRKTQIQEHTIIRLSKNFQPHGVRAASLRQLSLYGNF